MMCGKILICHEHTANNCFSSLNSDVAISTYIHASDLFTIGRSFL